MATDSQGPLESSRASVATEMLGSLKRLCHEAMSEGRDISPMHLSVALACFDELARAGEAMLPVVEAAEAWRDGMAGDGWTEHDWTLARAVDAYRESTRHES